MGGKIVRKTNELMMLDYAYQDEKGVTWKGGAYGLGPKAWRLAGKTGGAPSEIFLTDVQVLGAAGAIRN